MKMYKYIFRGKILKLNCITECGTEITYHKIYVVVFIPKMFHQLLKALFFPTNLKTQIFIFIMYVKFQT